MLEPFFFFSFFLKSPLGCFDNSCRKTNALPLAWTPSNMTSPELRLEIFETVQPQPSGETQQITTDLINSSCINLNRQSTKKTKIMASPTKTVLSVQACKQLSPQDVGHHMESSCEQLEQPTFARTFVGEVFFFFSRVPPPF